MPVPPLLRKLPGQWFRTFSPGKWPG